MRNKVVEIIDSAERIEREINFIVNTSGVGILPSEKALRLKEKLQKLVKEVQADMIEIHDLEAQSDIKDTGSIPR